MIFTIMIFSLVFSNKVSAEVLEQFSEYTEPQFTTEMIDAWHETYSIDKSVYDSYLITLHQRGSGTSTFNYYYAVLYKSTDLESGKINIYNDDNYYYIKYTNYTYRYGYNANLLSTEKFNLGSKKVSLAYQGYEAIIANNINSQIDLVGYYSNRDIKDQNGNIIIKKNDFVEPIEDPNLTNTREFLFKLTNFYKSLFSIISNIASTIITTPILLIPFGFCILAIVVGVFYKLFLRR